MKKYIFVGMIFLVSLFCYAMDEDQWEYSFIRALNFEEKEEIDKAIEELEKSRALRPDDPLILRELGYCYGRKGKFIEAKECYERVLKFYPNDENAIQNLSFLNSVLQEKEKTRKE